MKTTGRAWWQTFTAIADAGPNFLRSCSSLGGPSVAQRKMLEAAFTGWANKTARLTEDRSVRIVVNASSWFDQPIRAFDPSALTSALEYIGVAPLTARLIQSARELEANLGLARGMVVPGVAPVLEATHVTPFGAFG